MVKVSVVDTLTLRGSLRIKSTPAGKGSWITDIRTGDDYTRCLEGWGTRSLEMDRARDVYREGITLYDGTRLESTAQLTDHHD
jgi:hypothetical protein